MFRGALALACAAACTHPSTPPVAPELTNRVAVATPRHDGNPLDYVPIDADVVIGLDFQRLQRGALWQRFVAPAIAKNVAQLALFHQTCGFDPLATVTTVVMGATSVGHPDGSVAIVIQGPERVAMSDCMTKLVRISTREAHPIVQDGEAFYGGLPDGKQYAVAFPGDHTMLVVTGPTADKGTLATRLARKNSVTTSQAFTEVLGEVDRSRMFWLVANGHSMMSQFPFGVSPRVVFGTLEADDGLALDLRVRVGDPAEATQLTSQLNSSVASFRTMVDRLDIAAENSDMHITGAMSAAKIAALTGLFGNGKQSLFAPTP